MSVPYASATMVIYPISLLVLATMLAALSPQNWRTGLIRNGAAAAVLAGGFASIVVKARFGTPADDAVFPVSWALLAFGLLVMGFRFGLGLGAAKLLIAILPWMPPVHYLWMITVFGASHWALGMVMVRHGHVGAVPAVPALAFATFVVGMGAAVMRYGAG